eukprot:gene4514-biopygen3674
MDYECCTSCENLSDEESLTNDDDDDDDDFDDDDDDEDDNEDSYYATESSEEDDVRSIEDEETYDPPGVESDDDDNGCCYWSKNADIQSQNTLSPNEDIPEFGKPKIVFQNDAKPHDVVESIMDDEFVLMCIESTNEHRENDPQFRGQIGRISSDEKGIQFMRGFFAIKWHLQLLGYPQYRWAWSEDPLKAQPEIKKLMSRDVFRLLLKHFRVIKSTVLPARAHPTYHPLQNINAGVEYLRQKSLSKWSVGWKLCVDEGRVVSKSKRNPYKIRNPDKPVRMGWTVCKVSDKGKFGGNFVINHVTKVGKKTYRNAQNGKNYDIVEQLLSGYKGTGRLVVMDSGYPTLKLLTDAKRLWQTRMIATQRGNTAHLPSNHKANIKASRSFLRGFSQSLHNGNLNVTYWNDNNVVVFLDNDIKSGEAFWQPTQVNQGAERVVINVPFVAQLYREIYGWVDKTNQQLSYYNTGFRSVRKQSRIYDSLCEMYVLVNGHTLWRNSPYLLGGLSRDDKSQSSFRFSVIRVWYAKYRMTNGKHAVLHYPTGKLSTKKRSLEATITSPKKGRHDNKRITSSESSSKECRLKCRICHKKTSFMCGKCSSPGEPLPLCSTETGRYCWNEYHVAREFDVASNNSQEDPNN